MRSMSGPAPLIPTYISLYWSKLLALHSIKDAHLWAFDDRSLDAAPHLAHCCKKTFRLVYAVEFKFDDGVIWIVNRP